MEVKMFGGQSECATFNFSTLDNAKALDLDKMFTTVSKLSFYLQNDAIYTQENSRNIQVALNYFIKNSVFMIKIEENACLLEALFGTLADMLKKLRLLMPDEIVFFEYGARLAELLLLVAKGNNTPISVKCTASNVLSELLLSPTEEIDGARLNESVRAVLAVYIENNCLKQSLQVCGSLLTSKYVSRLPDLPVVSQWLCKDCVFHLIREENEDNLLKILECLTIFMVKVREVWNECHLFQAGEQLAASIMRVCELVEWPALQSAAKLLVQQLVASLCVASKLDDELLQSVLGLPNRLSHWPDYSTKLFLLICHVQYFYTGEILWSSGLIANAITSYLSRNLFPAPNMVRALALLFPLVPNLRNDKYVNARMVEMLKRCKQLQSVLCYDKTQMAWLLEQPDSDLRICAFHLLLGSGKSDHDITDLVRRLGLECLLVEYVVSCRDGLNARVFSLLENLLPDPGLSLLLSYALPVVSTDPSVFASLLKIKLCLSPRNEYDPALPHLLVVSLPTITDELAVKGACKMCMQLLQIIPHRQQAMLTTFFTYPITIRFLIHLTASKNMASAGIAINLLVCLKKIQNAIQCDSLLRIVLPFAPLLRGIPQNINSGLNLLTLVLSPRSSQLFELPPNCHLSLYHRLNIVACSPQTSEKSFRVLRMLLSKNPNLANVSATSMTVELICKSYLPDGSGRKFTFFLKFLESWIGILKGQFACEQFCDAPLADIMLFLDKVDGEDTVELQKMITGFD